MHKRGLLTRFREQNYVAVEANDRRFRFNGLPDDAADPDGAFTQGIEKALEAVDAVRAERERLRQDGRFTPKGIRQRLMEKAEELAATEVQTPGEEETSLAWTASYVKTLQNRIAKKRSRLDGPPTAESEVEVARDSEMREYLRSQEPRDRRRILNGAVADGRDDVVRAAVDASPELAGLTPEHQEDIRERVIRKRNPDLVQEIEADMKALNSLERTLETAQEAIAAVATEPVEMEEDEAA